ncbi:MAG: hypothetical protein ABSC08_19880 [Bryobacteraceae bacterium]|jgi:hypothetical protein
MGKTFWFLGWTMLLATLPVMLASNKNLVYDVGTFVAGQQVSDGTYGSASGGFGESHAVGHTAHVVVTAAGTFVIEPPTSVFGSMVMSMATDGHAPTMRKAWFMDDLHNGDKVLFNAVCSKHGRCVIKLPNPENPNKVYVTQGMFHPNVGKTNTFGLCGTGKLTADAEAQLCGK